MKLEQIKATLAPFVGLVPEALRDKFIADCAATLGRAIGKEVSITAVSFGGFHKAPDGGHGIVTIRGAEKKAIPAELWHDWRFVLVRFAVRLATATSGGGFTVHASGLPEACKAGYQRWLEKASAAPAANTSGNKT